MKKTIVLILVTTGIISCTVSTKDPASPTNAVVGTWELFSATTIVKADSTTDFTKDQQMIKIINDSHFAFFRHDLNKGKDSSTAFYGSGGGRYTLAGDQYTEQLDYCSDREWEGHEFKFTVSVSNDTLIQRGTEKIENLGIDRVIIEKYIRTKK